MLDTWKESVRPTCKVHVSQPCATPCKGLDGSVGYVCGVTEVEVVKMFSEKADILDSAIGEFCTLGQDKVSDLWCVRYDAVNGIVGDE